MDVYSGSPRSFYSEFMDGRDMMKCLDTPFTHPDGSACAYLDVRTPTHCILTYVHPHVASSGSASISRLLKIIGLFC